MIQLEIKDHLISIYAARFFLLKATEFDETPPRLSVSYCHEDPKASLWALYLAQYLIGSNDPREGPRRRLSDTSKAGVATNEEQRNQKSSTRIPEGPIPWP